MPDNVGSVVFQSGFVENVASAYRFASLCLSVQKLRLFGIRYLEIRMSLDMKRYQFYARVGLF